MEVLVIAHTPFHDPAARWKVLRDNTEVRLLIGSEADRICITLTAAEMEALTAALEDQ